MKQNSSISILINSDQFWPSTRWSVIRSSLLAGSFADTSYVLRTQFFRFTGYVIDWCFITTIFMTIHQVVELKSNRPNNWV